MSENEKQEIRKMSNSEDIFENCNLYYFHLLNYYSLLRI